MSKSKKHHAFFEEKLPPHDPPVPTEQPNIVPDYSDTLYVSIRTRKRELEELDQRERASQESQESFSAFCNELNDKRARLVSELTQLRDELGRVL